MLKFAIFSLLLLGSSPAAAQSCVTYESGVLGNLASKVNQLNFQIASMLLTQNDTTKFYDAGITSGVIPDDVSRSSQIAILLNSADKDSALIVFYDKNGCLHKSQRQELSVESIVLILNIAFSEGDIPKFSILRPPSKGPKGISA